MIGQQFPISVVLGKIGMPYRRLTKLPQMMFEDQINILVYFHLEEHRSGRHLLQVLKEEHFARQHIEIR